LIKIEEKYATAFGRNTNGRRHKVNSWISESEGMCASMSVDFIKNGKSRLDYCKKKLDDGRSKWQSLEDFTKAYLTMATKLISFASQSIVIMQTSSHCDPKKYDQNVINDKCKWKSTIDNLLTKSFDTQGRALFLSKAMQTLDTECSPTAAGWPFSQVCSEAKCNYKFALMLEKDSWKQYFGSLNEEGKYVVLKEFRSDNTYVYCSGKARGDPLPEGWQPKGLTAFAHDWLGDHYVQGTCEEVQSYYFNFWNDYLFRAMYGAVPNFGLIQDFPKCAALINDVTLWDPHSPSEGSLKRYPWHLKCKDAPDSYYQIGPDESEQACWRKCYYEAKLKPTFYFSVIETFPGIENLCLCHSTWYVIQRGLRWRRHTCILTW
jgi:hypothetical protein